MMGIERARRGGMVCDSRGAIKLSRFDEAIALLED